MEVFDDVMTRDLVRPNEPFFVTMIDSCNRLSDKENWQKHVTGIVQECKKAGFLSRRVLSTLRRQATNTTLSEILECANTDSLPGEWSRRVEKRNRP